MLVIVWSNCYCRCHSELVRTTKCRQSLGVFLHKKKSHAGFCQHSTDPSMNEDI